jgi:hypothetical protein
LEEKMKNKLKLLGFILIIITLFFACEDSDSGGDPPAEPYLFMTDTYNGNVYLYDVEGGIASDTVFLSTGANATGYVYFYNDIGYITVGAPLSGPDNKGLYYFYPEADVPVVSKVGGANSISAQFIAFYNDNTAYVTEAGPTTGVYFFNPTDPSIALQGPVPGTNGSGMYLQDIVTGTDGYIYTADNSNGVVIKIDPATNTVVQSYTMNSIYTTGLVAAEINGADSIIAASTSTIDMLDCTTGTVTTIYSIGAVYIDLDGSTGSLYATGWSNTYYIDISGTAPYAAVEIMDAGGSFGGSDVYIYDGYVYVSYYEWSTPYSSKLYIIQAGTVNHAANSPLSVMDQDNDGITGLAVYEY